MYTPTPGVRVTMSMKRPMKCQAALFERQGIGPKSLPPAAAIAKWTFRRSGRTVFNRITANSNLYVSGDPRSFEAGANGATLVWGSTTYSRTAGSGRTLVGTWLGGTGSGTEEVIFRADGTSVIHFVGETQDYLGIWTTDGNLATGLLDYEELRAVTSWVGTVLTIDTIYGPAFVYDYEIDVDVMTWTEHVTGDMFIYDRVIEA